MQYGTRVSGTLKSHNVISAGEGNDLSIPGQVYQFDIETEGFSTAQEEQIISQLLTLEASTPDLKILHINADATANKITMQFTDTGPNSFSFIGLMGAMPAIFALILVVVLAYTLYVVYQNNPLLLWGILAAGVGAAIFFFTSGNKIIMPTKDIYTKGPAKPPSATAQYNQEQMNLRLKERIEADRQKSDSEKAIKEANEKIKELEQKIAEKQKNDEPTKALENQIETQEKIAKEKEEEVAEADIAIKEAIKEMDKVAKKKQKGKVGQPVRTN